MATTLAAAAGCKHAPASSADPEQPVADRFGEAPPLARPGNTENSAVLEATLHRGEAFGTTLTDGVELVLEPDDHGWWLRVRATCDGEDLSKVTPPLHAVPNPRHIQGWHFRNADNTGPNAPGPKNVNAPRETRDFIFTTIEPRSLFEEADGGDLEALYAAMDESDVRGRGSLTITDYELTPLSRGKRASFEQITFEINVEWRTVPGWPNCDGTRDSQIRSP